MGSPKAEGLEHPWEHPWEDEGLKGKDKDENLLKRGIH